VGKTGVAKTDIVPGRVGVVLAEHEFWSAVSEEHIKAGETVVIVDVDGLTLKVRRHVPDEAGS